MTLQQFVNQNRVVIDDTISLDFLRLGSKPYITDKDRRLWVEMDESLYDMATSEGVKM